VNEQNIAADVQILHVFTNISTLAAPSGGNRIIEGCGDVGSCYSREILT